MTIPQDRAIDTGWTEYRQGLLAQLIDTGDSEADVGTDLYRSPDNWGETYILTLGEWGVEIPLEDKEAANTIWYDWFLADQDEQVEAFLGTSIAESAEPGFEGEREAFEKINSMALNENAHRVSCLEALDLWQSGTDRDIETWERQCEGRGRQYEDCMPLQKLILRSRHLKRIQQEIREILV